MLITRAAAFATGAHAAIGQRRKYTDEPYYRHPERVAGLLSEIGAAPEVVAAGWLHDVVEDTGVTIELIEEMFGPAVAQLVAEVTDVSRPEHGKRAIRKELDRQHIANASPDGKSVKLADLIDNTSTIVRYDPDFALVYMREKRDLLAVLEGGDPVLLERAAGLVRQYFAEEEVA